MKCTQCEKEFEQRAGDHRLCLPCWKANQKLMYGKKTYEAKVTPTLKMLGKPTERISTETRILRSVLIKIASEQVNGRPAELVKYAMEMEQELHGWL